MPDMFQIQLGSEVKTCWIFRMHHEREKAVHKATREEGIFQSPQRKLEQGRDRRKCHSMNELPSWPKSWRGLSICILSATIGRTIQIDKHARIGLLWGWPRTWLLQTQKQTTGHSAEQLTSVKMRRTFLWLTRHALWCKTEDQEFFFCWFYRKDSWWASKW